MAFGVGFTQLNTIRKPANDPWPNIGPNFAAWVGTYLKEAEAKSNGKISSFAQERLSPEAQAGLARYMSA